MMGTTTPLRARARRRALALLAVGLLGLTAAACRLPSRYDVATVVDGLQNPWDIVLRPRRRDVLHRARRRRQRRCRGGQVTTFDRPDRRRRRAARAG